MSSLAIDFMFKLHRPLLLPKIICEGLSMKYFLCHLHNGAICIIRHFVLLRPIHSGCLLLNIMVLKKYLKDLVINFSQLSNRYTFILYSNCISTSTLKSLNLSKYFPLDFNTYNHTFSRNPQ